MTNALPFRFLDIPKEIRLLIYECLTTKITHHPIKHGNDLHNDAAPMKLVNITIPSIVILVTCRQVHAEASPIMAKKLSAIKSEPLRIISTGSHLLGSSLVTVLNNLFAPQHTSSWNDRLNALVPSISHGQDMRWIEGTSNTSPRHVCIALRTLLVHQGGQFEWDVKVLKRKLRDIEEDVRYVVQNREMRACVRPAWFDIKCGEQVQTLDFGPPNGVLYGGEAITKEEWEMKWAEGEQIL